jgi:hypothetical protein
LGLLNKKNEMGGTCSKNGRYEKYVKKLRRRKLMGRDAQKKLF